MRMAAAVARSSIHRGRGPAWDDAVVARTIICRASGPSAGFKFHLGLETVLRLVSEDGEDQVRGLASKSRSAISRRRWRMARGGRGEVMSGPSRIREELVGSLPRLAGLELLLD
ncbi:hypothetical protein CDD83_9220 [Cordyceps sp. RAO-2017]|nr:hypothetical protein CDD83_9220 [Cordyceps sp. RAO-2017]